MPETNFTLTSHLPETLEALERAKEQALIAIGTAAEGHAKENTPVVTGRLRNSITHAVKTDESAVYIGTNVEYAASVEFGSKHNPNPAHMLKRAVSEHSDEFKKLIKAAMKANS